MWGCAGAPPPVATVVPMLVGGVVVAAQETLRGEVLLKDCSVRHAISLSPLHTLPATKTDSNLLKSVFLLLGTISHQSEAVWTVFFLSLPKLENEANTDDVLANLRVIS